MPWPTPRSAASAWWTRRTPWAARHRPPGGAVSRRDERVSLRPVPVLRSSRVSLRPPLPRDAGAARRIGLYAEILRMFGEETDEEWRELTQTESAELLEALAPTADRVTWVVDAGEGFIGSASLHGFSADGTTAAYRCGTAGPEDAGSRARHRGHSARPGACLHRPRPPRAHRARARVQCARHRLL